MPRHTQHQVTKLDTNPYTAGKCQQLAKTLNPGCSAESPRVGLNGANPRIIIKGMY